MTAIDPSPVQSPAAAAGPRTYLPSDYVDEWCPPLRRSPFDWAVRADGGWHMVACPDYMDDDDGDRPGPALADGQVVKFDWRENWPDRTVTVRVNGDGQITHDPIGYLPASLNMFWLDGDFDTMTDTLQSCLEAYHEMEKLEDGQELDLSMCQWGEDSFCFVVDGDAARFVALARQEHAHAAR